MNKYLLLIACVLFVPVPCVASSGNIVELISEPHKVVLRLRKNKQAVVGPCGGEFFDLERTNQNFNELYPLLLTAFSHGWPVNIHSKPCNEDSERNRASHASVSNPEVD